MLNSWNRYYVAANPSIDRHVCTAAIPTSAVVADYTQEFTALTDTSQPGYHDVLFSPGAGYYVLFYKGPEVPHQRLLEATEGGE